MARGRTSKVGDTRIAPNGYHYTKTELNWRLTHHVIAETTRGYPITETERVIFKDKDKKNLDPDNLLIVTKGASSKARERARLTARIQELTAQLNELK